MRIVIVSGLSGSGKSVALHTLEDEGFYCVDNMPATLITELVQQVSELSAHSVEKMAIGIDARSAATSIKSFNDVIGELKQEAELSIEVLFLETNHPTLIKRFSETRRKHPLTSGDTTLTEAIDKEANMLARIKMRSDMVIDTSSLNLHQLRELIRNQVIQSDRQGPALQFQSFGFKHGAPANTDFVFDVRCLPNPHWDPGLRAKTGNEQPVIDYLEEHQTVHDMFEDICAFLHRWLPVFQRENRSYLTVSIGCTGGRHRSVYLANRLAQHFQHEWENVSVAHRES